MMQQDLNLKEYIEYENYIYKERQKHKRKLKKYFDFINKI